MPACPVLVYFYGGGFMAGDGSEPRYDGESMARRGIVALTVNYRLGVFGFLAHPELTQESPQHASGNYGLLDQVRCAAVGPEEHRGLRRRPGQGHDRRRVGRVDLGQRADGLAAVEGPRSPARLARVARMIGPTLAPVSLAEGGESRVRLTPPPSASRSLAALRAMPAEQLLGGHRRAWSASDFAADRRRLLPAEAAGRDLRRRRAGPRAAAGRAGTPKRTRATGSSWARPSPRRRTSPRP